MRTLPALFALLSLAAAAAPARANDSAADPDADDATVWLGALYDRIGADLAAGRPLVVQAHVPLCDSSIIRCGNHGLGDGDSPRTNLYWSTSGGFVGWFGRPGSGWKQVALERPTEGDVLEIRVWHRTVQPNRGWRERGVTRPFEVYVVAHAWRGKAIDKTVTAYVDDLYGTRPRTVKLADGTELAAGGAAQIIAWVGHNRWMDIPRYDWNAAAKRAGEPAVKGAIAVACKTAAYMANDVPAPTRVPLLYTRDFLFAGAHSFEGAVRAVTDGAPLAAIRRRAAAAYAEGEGKSVRRVGYAFTNPADDRWPR